VVGEIRTGKSPLFAQMCHLLGLEPLEQHAQDLNNMTEAQIGGRRGYFQEGMPRSSLSPISSSEWDLLSQLPPGWPATGDLSKGATA